MKDHRGHVPELADPTAKRERCKACRASRRRGEKWAFACPGSNEARLRLLGYQEPTEDQRARGCFGLDSVDADLALAALERRG